MDRSYLPEYVKFENLPEVGPWNSDSNSKIIWIMASNFFASKPSRKFGSGNSYSRKISTWDSIKLRFIPRKVKVAYRWSRWAGGRRSTARTACGSTSLHSAGGPARTPPTARLCRSLSPRSWRWMGNRMPPQQPNKPEIDGAATRAPPRPFAGRRRPAPSSQPPFVQSACTSVCQRKERVYIYIYIRWHGNLKMFLAATSVQFECRP